MTEASTARRLRVAIVTPGFVVERDEPGMPAIVDLVERIASVHDCEVIALRHPPARPPYRVAGARVTALGVGTASGAPGRARVLAGGVGAVLRRHRRRPFDLVHALWADEAGAVATIAGRLVRRPVVVSVLGGELVDPGHRLRGGPRTGRPVDGRDLVPWRGPRDRRVVHGPRRDPRTAARATGRAPAPGRRHDRLPTGRSDGGRAADPDEPTPTARRSCSPAASNRSRTPRPCCGSSGAWRPTGPGWSSSSSATADCAPGWRRRRRDRLAGRVRFAGHVPRDEMPALFRSARCSP